MKRKQMERSIKTDMKIQINIQTKKNRTPGIKHNKTKKDNNKEHNHPQFKIQSYATQHL